METVDVLGDDGFENPQFFQVIESLMTVIGPGFSEDRMQFHEQYLPHGLRVLFIGIDVGILDGIDFFPESAFAAKGRDSALH